jgi:hypothetical protein
MEFRTTVKLFVEGSPSEWIPNAIVCLYDRDRVTRDDHLGTEMTDVYGEATFRFAAEDFMDLDDRVGGALPELYVEIYGTGRERVLTTRAEAVSNAVPDLIRVPVPRELAEQHGLI